MPINKIVFHSVSDSFPNGNDRRLLSWHEMKLSIFMPVKYSLHCLAHCFMLPGDIIAIEAH